MRELSTLSDDIDTLFFEGKIVDETNLLAFSNSITEILRERLAPKEDQPPRIRMSKLGIADRKLWYEHNKPMARTRASNALKFIYGDIIEQLILFLAKEAGHLVEDEQKEFIIDGIVGHQDAKIDGVTADVKSTSDYAFAKFSKRQLFNDDPFGYIAQLSAYAKADDNDKAAFIAVNKVTGQICVLPLDSIDRIDPVQRIERIKKVVTLESPPEEKCYSPIPYKTTNNITLNRNCTYCPYKHECWSSANNGQGLRYFNYSTGVVALTTVVDLPRVQEVFITGLADGESEEPMEEIIT